jgi:hypothetical protein
MDLRHIIVSGSNVSHSYLLICMVVEDLILPRLKELLAVNGEMYIVGTEPIPEKGKTG